MAINLDHVTEQITVTDTATNASLTVQPKGTGAFNIAAGSSGLNLSNGGTVTAVTKVADGANYTTLPTVAIAAPTTAGGVQAVLQLYMYQVPNTVAFGGTGYTVGNTLTVVGGTPVSSPTVLTVTSVSSGVITGVARTDFNAYTALPTNPVSVTGGSGSGATFNLVWGVGSIIITNAGSGYVEQPSITFSGGGGSGAAAYAGVGGIATIKALASNVASLQFATPGGVAFSVADTNRATVDYWEVIGSTGAIGLRVAGATGNNNGIITSKGSGYLSLQTNGFNSEALRATYTASSVNYVNATGAATGSGPTISAQGSDTNADLNLNPKGTGGVKATNTTNMIVQSIGSSGFGSFLASSSTGSAYYFGYSGGAETGRISMGSNLIDFATSSSANQQFRIAHTASAVNYIQATGAITGQSPYFSSQGSDTNIILSYSSKGTGGHDFYTAGSTFSKQLAVSHTASAVNYVNITGSPTGGATSVVALGSDANIPLSVASKGTGILYLGGGQTRIASNGSNSLYVSGPAGAVNYVAITSSATGITPSFLARGGDANVGLTFGTYNDANIDFYASGDPNAGTGKLQVRIAPIASAVNYLQLNGSVTGQLALIQTAGSDASVGLELRLKGTPVGPGFRISNNNGANVCFSVQTSVSAPANYHQMQPANAGSAPNIAIAGSDTNIDMNLTTKGTGSHNLNTGNGTAFRVSDFGGTIVAGLAMYAGSSGQNTIYVAPYGSGSGSNLLLASKGTGNLILATNTANNSTGNDQVRINHTASSVNYATLTGSATGFGVVLSAAGSDTNIPLVLQPKGTGALQAQQTDSTATGGNARGLYATDWQKSRVAASQVASSSYSFIGGGDSNTSAAFGSVVVGGSTNSTTGGAYNSILGGVSNATGANGQVITMGGGHANSAQGFFNIVGGGYANSGTSGPAVTTQSATMNGTTAVTLSGSNASIKVGQLISGTSIGSYPHTYVAAISGTSLTLSQAASGSSTSTLSFFTPHGVVVGGGNNQATGAYSFIGGGGDAGTAANRNVASGDWSVVAGGTKNTTSGIYSFIGGGAGNTASQLGAVVCGGGAYATSGFAPNVAANVSSFIGAGLSNLANSNYGFIGAGVYGTTRGIAGNHAFPACDNPTGSFGIGTSQAALLVLGTQTTDATATVLRSSTAAAGTTNQVILPNNSAYFFTGEVVAGVTGGGDTKGWKIEGVIKRGANAASTALVGTPTVTSMYADVGAATWTIALSADTTNGGLAVTFTGQLATTIRVVAQIRTTEMTF